MTETEIKSCSQVGQDKWVLAITGLTHGLFLDIGCGTREFYSNTWMLEQLGWTGWLVDNNPTYYDDMISRGASVVRADATKCDYGFLPDKVDYLSLDVDAASLDALKALPLDRVRFRCITAEHDAYRFGDTYRTPMRNLLLAHGYEIAVADVAHDGMEFEDWYVG